MANCLTGAAGYGNTGSAAGLKNLGLGMPVSIIPVIPGFSLAAADFITFADWITAIKAREVFPIKNIKEFIDSSTDIEFVEHADKSRSIKDYGKYRYQANVEVSPCLMKQLMMFRNANVEILIAYDNNSILGTTEDDGVTVKGLTAGMFTVGKPYSKTTASGTNEGLVPIYFDLDDEQELSKYFYAEEMTWNVKKLDGLTPATVSVVGTPTTTEVVVDVILACAGGCDTPQLGLTAACFVLGTGTVVSSSSVVAGRYTLVCTGANTSVNLCASSALPGTDILIISTGAATFTAGS